MNRKLTGVTQKVGICCKNCYDEKEEEEKEEEKGEEEKAGGRKMERK